MVLSKPTWVQALEFGPHGCEYECDFGHGQIVKVKGLPYGK